MSSLKNKVDSLHAPVYLLGRVLRNKVNPIKLQRMLTDRTQAEIAKTCKWSITHQKDIEKGRVRLTSEQIAKLEDALGIDLSNFTNRKNIDE